MPKGGRREGAGRKPGSTNKRKRAVVQVIEAGKAEGMSPVEAMLINCTRMMDLADKLERRVAGVLDRPDAEEEELRAAFDHVVKARSTAHDFAAAAAPYLHPRWGTKEPPPVNPLPEPPPAPKPEEVKQAEPDRLAALAGRYSKALAQVEPEAGPNGKGH